MKIIGIIPARLAATRLPNKPLLDILGKPLIQRVWERASQAKCLDGLFVATPDQAIYDAVVSFGGKAVMTSVKHRSGTDRLAEAVADRSADIVVNIQGDEPLIDPASIDIAVVPFLEDPSLQMASLMCPCPESDEDNPACVKVVCDVNRNAIYFSRSKIPYQRSPDNSSKVMQHVGLYAFRREFLLQFASMQATPLELSESLEQLRALEHGVKIRMVEISESAPSIDTPDDLIAVCDRLRINNKAGISKIYC